MPSLAYPLPVIFWGSVRDDWTLSDSPECADDSIPETTRPKQSASHALHLRPGCGMLGTDRDGYR